MQKPRLIASLVLFAAGFTLSTVVDLRNLVSRAQVTVPPPTVSEPNLQTSQKSSPPQFWDYRAVEGCSDNKLTRELGNLGSQGFEVFSVTGNRANIGNAVCMMVLLRRPK